MGKLLLLLGRHALPSNHLEARLNRRGELRIHREAGLRDEPFKLIPKKQRALHKTLARDA